MALIDVRVHLKVVGVMTHYNKYIFATDYWMDYISRHGGIRGQKGPISYFSAGNVPQSTPPSTNQEQYLSLMQAGEVALQVWALLAIPCQATRLT